MKSNQKKTKVASLIKCPPLLDPSSKTTIDLFIPKSLFYFVVAVTPVKGIPKLKTNF